ncbi:MAG TPA: FAD-dependent oxidoreductase [Aggregatilineales bacterium]|nr:FAD-dependent oxidoreductase [Aggregatilineales bacterium]HPV08316.1 FAD-dependent oxidoreductase [Aggregatilineales bacterium]HQA67611.1 FAD-dependent oxidoreductase [Aggregatilineales bacterium]HQE16905.1 FAD-dependent oxidoreductase [Aggregatilineales bacterium]
MGFDLNLGLTGLGSEPYDVIIIGGGPAGASAAIYTARADLKTLVIDKGLTAGALGVTSKISNYPGVPGPISGAELVETMRKQAESFGAEFLTDKVVGVDLKSDPKMVQAGTGTFFARAVILATGSMGRTNSVPGEEELLGRGVSYCATCDGAFFRGKDVAVVGNNDEALEEALFLTKFARRITLISPTPALKARPELEARLRASDKVEVRLGTRLKEIIGESRVEGVRIHPRGGEEEVLPVEGAFVYLQGGLPITDFVDGQLKREDGGCLVVDRERQTTIPGVFAVGDLLCEHIKQAVIAAADGVIAAIAVERHLNERSRVRVDWN